VSNSLTILEGSSMFIVPYAAFDFVSCRIREEEENESFDSAKAHS